MIKTVKEAKKILRKGNVSAYNGNKKIGTTYAIDNLLAVRSLLGIG